MVETERQITTVVAQLQRSVVSVGSVRMARDWRFGAVPLEGQGTGVIIDPKGYVVTNNHVVANAERVQVTLEDGRSFVGEVIGSDPATDIALVRVEAKDLPAARFADSEKLKVGQFALAIGNALGLPGAPTVSLGVVSAIGRPLPGTDFILEGFIQTDAAINPGNSGGPLADINGDVIGINTAMIPFAQGLGFAIPAHTVKTVVDQILSKGRVVRPWLGISGLDVTPAVSRRYSLGTESGVLVAEVSRGSPADEAGLRRGDVVVGVGDGEVKKMRDLLTALQTAGVGDGVRLVVIRFGRRYEVSARLEEAPVQVVERRWRE
ncbi:MAG TPA: trypsin-like peptidase domain-containing protein [Conexivisphaerales archaeon]|nr:trypsin-like peptidase domain-containing protein [Conexivisphaerales archaeon]